MIRVIQAGLGGMGNAWLRAVQSSDEVTYAGFVEVNQEIAQRQAATYALDPDHIFPTLEEALASVDADGIIVVTPPQFHRDISIAALKAGVAVLTEKPLADTMESARDIVRVAQDTGVLHMVAQNYRYTRVARTIRQALQGRRLGAVSNVAIEFFRGPRFGGFREQMPYPLVVDMAIHHFDLLRFFLGSDPVSVYGKSWNPPWSWFAGDASASLLFTFPRDLHVAYNGSWCSLGRETSWNANWRFDTERGALVVRDDVIMVEQSGQEPSVVPLMPMPRVGQAYLLHEFHDAVTTGMQPATTCQDNVKSLQMVFDSIRSFETGEPIAFGG